MPWTPADAERHTKLASSAVLQRLWAIVANDALKKGADDATAIKEANAAVKRRVADPPRHRVI